MIVVSRNPLCIGSGTNDQIMIAFCRLTCQRSDRDVLIVLGNILTNYAYEAVKIGLFVDAKTYF
jgi:hypothetical protein